MSLLALTVTAVARPGQPVTIPAEPLKQALDSYIAQTGAQLIYNADDTAGAVSNGVQGLAPDAALTRMLDGTGLAASRDPTGAIVVTRTRPVEVPRDLTPEHIVVTGSRITGSPGLSTPVVSVTADQLLATTPGGIPEALNKLPIFMSGQTPNNVTSGANGRGGNAPGYFLNLRNLGAIRTLILQDSHRVPGTFFDTTVDVDMLPQMLMDRVEVVTGGAAAVYGSDAVTGVVNFLLDKGFDGFKSLAQAGISGYGDARSLHLGLAAGTDIGAHGHLIFSLEYRLRDALPDAAARPLGNLGASIVGSGTAAIPYALVTDIRQSNTAPGGLIVSGPGAGLQFRSDGSLGPFNPGLPTPTTNFSIGGDGGIEHNEYLLPAFATGQAFAHYEHDFGSFSGHVEARYAQARSYEAGQIFTNINGSGISTNGSGAQYPITIYSGNAFLQPAAQAFLFPAGGPLSFQMNRMDNDLMSRLSLDQHTGALAMTAGFNGALNSGLSWDVNYTHGETRTQLTARNNVDSAKFYAALDAVHDPVTGNIVCNATLTAPAAFPGCVPLNLFGQSATVVNGSNASQEALNYVGSNTWWVARNGLDDFSANLTGTFAQGWAGPIKAALGVEYRQASLDVSTSTPDNSFNSHNLRLAPPGTFAITVASPLGTFPPTNLANFKEVQSGADGSESVSEANIELDVPLLRDLPGVGLFSVNAAARYTEYNVGGVDPITAQHVERRFSASTWKLGAEWLVTDTFKFRATRSRDIRAPTLWDLFQGPVTSTSGMQDSLTGASGSINTRNVGNPNLKPEVARNTTIGVVHDPDWLPGLRMTADYFHIAIDREIAAITGSNPVVQGLCLGSDGTSPYCALIQRPISYNSTSPLNFPTLFYSQAQNFQRQWTEGVDFEVAYRMDLADWTGLSGLLDVRLLWTHTAFLKTLGLPGSVITDVAGSANAPQQGLPSEKSVLMLGYADGGWSLDVMERYYGAIRQNPNPTLIYAANTGDLPAWFQTDVNIARDFGGLTAFLNVSNLFDAQPDIFQVPGYTGSPGMNYPVVPYEDVIGRYFTLGLKARLD